MKASILAAITFAIAVTAMPPSAPKGAGDIVANQCKSGTLQCCVHADKVEDKGLLNLLDGFTLLNLEAMCSPISVLSDIHINILGSDSEKNGNLDCQHTVSCCNDKKVCAPIVKSHGSGYQGHSE